MSHAELLTLQRLGERLTAAYARLIEELPKDARGISGMARYLDIHKATCQRVVEGTTSSADAIEALARFPGIKALRQHLEACERRGMSAAVLDPCAAAITQMEAELESRHLSRQGLIDFLASLRYQSEGASSSLQDRRATEQRRSLHNAAKGLCGEDLEAKVAIGVIMPSKKRPDRLEITLVSAMLGVAREPFARPIAPFVLNGWHDQFETIGPGKGRRPAGEEPRFALLEEFSTAGLRTSRLAGDDARTLLVVDTESTTPGATVDVAIMFSSDAARNPLVIPGARITAAARIIQPTHLLISDTYVHTSIASEAPRIACMALTAPPGDAPGGGLDECWYDRFPDTPRLMLLDPSASIGARATRAERITQRLTDFLFRTVHEQLGLNVRELVGHRCIVKYPIWQSEYRAYL
jgi:hypothetical protein